MIATLLGNNVTALIHANLLMIERRQLIYDQCVTSMKIGSVIKYLRTKSKMTQSELAKGICSIPHLSKIENNNKDANKETIELLLSRLGTKLTEIKIKDKEVKFLLDKLIENIHHYHKTEAQNIYEKLKASKEFIPFTPYLYLYELYVMRYMLFIGDIENVKVQRKWLNKHKKNFSQYENYLFNYYFAIFLIMNGQYTEAERELDNLLLDDRVRDEVQGEHFYHISLVKGNLGLSGQAIFYGKKALQIYTNQFNFKRILHTLMLLGINYTHSKLYQEAYDCYRHVLRNVDESEESNFRAQVFHNIGYLLDKMGVLDKSLSNYKKSLELFPKDSIHYLISLYSVSEINYRMGSTKEALKYFIKTLELAEVNSNQKYVLLSKYYILKLNGPDEASTIFLEEVLVPYLESTDENAENLEKFKSHLFFYYEKLGNLEKAFKYIDRGDLK